jgi:hypothetical protein
MNLTDEQKKMCFLAGEYGFDAGKLSVLLDIPESEVFEALNDHSSEIYICYQKGKTNFMVEPFQALKKKAIEGDRHAAKDLYKMKKDLEVQQMIDKFLGE